MFEPIDRHSTLPRFVQVVNGFETALRAGRLRAGQMLPREAELCAQFGVSRKTLRRATDHLAKLALIRRMQGVGTVVAEDARIAGLGARRPLRAEVLSARPVPDTRILSQVRVVVDVELSRRTGFRVGDELLQLRRFRAVDGEPYAILEDLGPAVQAGEPGEAEAARSGCGPLPRRTAPSSLIRQEIEARLPTREQAAELGIAETTPLLCERVSSFDDMGELLHLSTNYYHPVNYRMVAVTVPDSSEPAGQPRSAASGD